MLLLMAGTLFILANQLFGALLAVVLRSTATAISVASLVTASAFGFMGVGFPRFGMTPFAYYWGGALPGTWYMTARIDQTLRGTPADLSLQPLAVLLFMVVVLAALTAFCLQRQGHKRQKADLALEALS